MTYQLRQTTHADKQTGQSDNQFIKVARLYRNFSGKVNDENLYCVRLR